MQTWGAAEDVPAPSGQRVEVETASLGEVPYSSVDKGEVKLTRGPQGWEGQVKVRA